MRIFPGKVQTGCINAVAHLDGAPAQATVKWHASFQAAWEHLHYPAVKF